MRFKVFATAAASFAWFCNPASAADFAPTPAPLPPVPALPQDGASIFPGFYVRVDGGVGFNGRPSLATLPSTVGTPAGSPVDPNYGGVFTRDTYTAARLGDSAFGGLGLGYQFTPWLRFDVTGEYRGGAKLTATNVLDDAGTTPGPFGGLASSHTAVSNFSGRLASAVFLANGYVDLGKYWGFTPFVGGGVGVTSNALSRLADTGVYTTRVAGVPAFDVPTSAFLPARRQTVLAWALMAGIAYDITPNLKLEAGYRYLDLGSFRSGTENAVLPGGAILALPYYGRGRDFVASDIKVGLRWSFAPATAPDQPLTRRY